MSKRSPMCPTGSELAGPLSEEQLMALHDEVDYIVRTKFIENVHYDRRMRDRFNLLQPGADFLAGWFGLVLDYELWLTPMTEVLGRRIRLPAPLTSATDELEKSATEAVRGQEPPPRDLPPWWWPDVIVMVKATFTAADKPVQLGTSYGLASTAESSRAWRSARGIAEWQATDPALRRRAVQFERTEMQVRVHPADSIHQASMMAAKRAKANGIRAILRMSDQWTSDIEDMTVVQTANGAGPAPRVPAPAPAARVSAPQVSAPQVVAPQVSAPQVAVPQVAVPQVSAPQVPAPQVAEAVPEQPEPAYETVFGALDGAPAGAVARCVLTLVDVRSVMTKSGQPASILDLNDGLETRGVFYWGTPRTEWPLGSLVLLDIRVVSQDGRQVLSTRQVTPAPPGEVIRILQPGPEVTEKWRQQATPF